MKKCKLQVKKGRETFERRKSSIIVKIIYQVITFLSDKKNAKIYCSSYQSCQKFHQSEKRLILIYKMPWTENITTQTKNTYKNISKQYKKTQKFIFLNLGQIIITNINCLIKFQIELLFEIVQQSQKVQKMAGSNSHCYYQTCAYNCCNRNGDCPQTYPSWYTSYYTDCYYYYTTSNSATGGAIAGYVIAGVFVLVFVIIAVVCYMRRKNQQSQLEQIQANQQQTTFVQQDPSLNTLGYNQPTYGQPDPYAQPYVQPYVQPQPYAQPYVQPQPYAQPYAQPYPQQQGPIIIHKT